MKDILSKIGQFFVAGFQADEAPPNVLDFIKEVQLGGVILFENNCSSFELVDENIRKVRDCYSGGVPFIAIDQEGGSVCRIKRAPAEYLSASEYGSTNDLEKFIEDYSRAALHLQTLGVNINLAPVADLSLNPKNRWLNERCFSADPKIASQFVVASVEIARKSNILSCLKHFPGLGDSVIDPHLESSKVEYDEISWEEREFKVFDAGIKSGADFVMTTHMSAPKLDDKLVTVSKKIIKEYLRDRLNFEGPIITDDLSMKGADSIGDIGERTVQAFNAGHDILLFGQNFDVTLEAYEYFVNACERGEISEEKILASLSRISGAKIKLESSVFY